MQNVYEFGAKMCLWVRFDRRVSLGMEAKKSGEFGRNQIMKHFISYIRS